MINVTNSSGGDVNCSGHCNNNFSDLRFTNESGDIIPHWIEYKVNGDYAIVWVNNSYNDSTLYMYYGNSEASDSSSGDDTFCRFDDFESYDVGDSINGVDYWTYTVDNNAYNYHKIASNPSGSGQVLHGHSSSSDQTPQYAVMNVSLLNRYNLSFDYSLYRDASSTYNDVLQEDGTFITGLISPTFSYRIVSYDGSAYKSTSPQSQVISATTWYDFNHRIFSTGHTYVVNGNEYDASLRASSTSPIKAYHLWYPFRKVNADMYFDDFRVRYYTTGTEPSFSFGSEETERITYYEHTIRNTGIDYFVWLGSNTSAYHVAEDIENFDESSEYIGIWNNGTWDSADANWNKYYGDASGTNFTINTFMVVQVYLTDSGTQVINMTGNNDMNYTKSYTYTWVNNSVNKGYNYTGYNKVSGTTLSDINTSVTLQNGEAIGRWNTTSYTWNWYLPYFYEPNIAVSRWDVIISKVEDNEVWNT